MKKLYAILLSLAMLLTLIPMGAIPVAAATSGTTGDCTWVLDGTHLTISGNGAMGNHDYVGDNPAPWGTFSPPSRLKRASLPLKIIHLQVATP